MAKLWEGAMAVTITYQFQLGNSLGIPNATGTNELLDFELTSLTNGAIASAGVHPNVGGDHVDVAVWDNPKLKGFPALEGPFTGAEASIDQLAGGDLVVATAAGGDIFYTILALSGGPVADPTGMSATDVTQPDVAALSDGGFVMVGKKHFGAGTDNDIYVWLRNFDGTERLAALTPDGAISDDEAPSVCGLADGGFAVAWHRDDGAGNTEIRYAVYEASGAVRKAAAVFDTEGAINRDASIVALPDGGFAIVYEETGATQQDIAFAKFDSAGIISGAKFDMTAPAGGVSPYYMNDPYATLLSNGMVAITATYVTDGVDDQVAVQLVNPTTLTKLLTGFQVITPDYNNVQSTAAGFGDAGLAVGWENDGVSSEGRKLQLVRTTTGTSGDNNLTGDDAVDLMSGAGGDDKLRGFDNNDSLQGGLGRDSLLAGRGNDALIGGAADDVLSGAQGKDVFRFLNIYDSVFGGADLIADLENKDRIDLSLIDANANKGGDQKFELVAEFTGHAGEARLHHHLAGPFEGYTSLELDVNGDSVADGFILMTGDHESFTRFAF
jgi:Ca2+-binding RTX toxin-like protein